MANQAKITVRDPATGREVSWTPTSLKSAMHQARYEEEQGAVVRIVSRNGRVVWDTETRGGILRMKVRR